MGGCLGEHPVEWRKMTQDRVPQAAVVIGSEQLRGRAGGDPRGPAQFSFELAGAPAGVAEEGADDSAWAI